MSRVSRFLTLGAVSIGTFGVAALTWHVVSFLAPAIFAAFTGKVAFATAFAFAKSQLIALGIDFLALLGLATCYDVILKSPPMVLLVTVLLGGVTAISAILSAASACVFAGLISTIPMEPSTLSSAAAGTVVFGILAVVFGVFLAMYREWAAA